MPSLCSARWLRDGGSSSSRGSFLQASVVLACSEAAGGVLVCGWARPAASSVRSAALSRHGASLARCSARLRRCGHASAGAPNARAWDHMGPLRPCLERTSPLLGASTSAAAARLPLSHLASLSGTTAEGAAACDSLSNAERRCRCCRLLLLSCAPWRRLGACRCRSCLAGSVRPPHARS
jgi:hypothetical protein